MELLNKFSRITSGRKIIKEIDGLRFVAVLLVVLSHISIYLLQFSRGNSDAILTEPVAIEFERFGAGISIFFVISGFILAIPFAEQHLLNCQPVNIKRYYFRRLTRLEPPYIIVLFVLFIVTILFFQSEVIDTIKHLLASLFYIHNIVYDRRSTINPVAWTLEIEIQFYLLVPLLTQIFRLRNHTVRRIILVACLYASSWLYSQNFSTFQYYHLDISLFTYFHVFITGILLADIYVVNKNLFSTAKSYLLDVIGVIALFTIIQYTDYRDFLQMTLVLLSYFILFTTLFRGKILNSFFTSTAIIIIGGMCYSIYLLHYAIIYVFMNYLTGKLITNNYHYDLVIQCLILLPVILIFSSIFFTFFEKPFMNRNWPKTFMNKISPSNKKTRTT